LQLSLCAVLLSEKGLPTIGDPSNNSIVDSQKNIQHLLLTVEVVANEYRSTFQALSTALSESHDPKENLVVSNHKLTLAKFTPT